ncbi:MAG TPA: class II aldolase/adducin family protein, partial [Candidatus Limnocylindrales bacterium]|nr:class II aldolase/adducin family protein [Candidatus Limnocylindrales bacterium]
MAKLEIDMMRWGRLLFERRLISGWGGNLSRRVGKDNFLITGQHAPLAFLRPKDLVRLNSDGKPLRKEQRASSETPMHMAVYSGTDAQAIVHVHPPLVLAFSLTHDSFVPESFEEKYTIGEVPIIAQDTPTVTKPEKVVEALRYHPVAIIKGHGTVAIGKTFQDAFLLTDLLEEAVHCQFYKEGVGASREAAIQPAQSERTVANGKRYELFSKEHMTALVKSANGDADFRKFGRDTCLTTSLTLHMEENNTAWTVKFLSGEITELKQQSDGDFLISGQTQWWNAVFSNKIDAFLATQQGKLKLKRGELAQLSRWYKPFQRAFVLWQTIP